MSADLTSILNQILTRLSNIESKVGIAAGSAGAGTSSSEGDLPASVRGYDQYLEAYLAPFLAAAKKLGGEAEAASLIVQEGWKEQRKLILAAIHCKEPPQSQLPEVLKGVSTQIQAATKLVKRNEWEKHTKTVSEGIGALNWVVVKPAPRDFIESAVGGLDYWANAIRKEYRTTNPDQVAYVDTFKALIVQLIAYVKEYHLTGLKWNAAGVAVNDYNPAASSTAATTATAAVAPAKPAATTTTSSGDKGSLFSSLNREGAVTTGLKKVTKDMQTWRPEFKADAAPTPAPKAAPAPAAKPAAANQPKGPPKVEFQDGSSKWLVENQTSRVEINIKDKKETVYILNSIGATIDIKGKCKSIVVDSCKKSEVIFDVAMASIEVVNCQRMQITVRDTVSAVAIDKTDGIIVNLPKTSLHTEVVASKSSEMNLSWPNENGDIIEKPIPEQYVHRIKDDAITANVSDLYGH